MDKFTVLALVFFSMVVIGYIILMVKLYPLPRFRRFKKWFIWIAIGDILLMAGITLWIIL